MIPTKLTMLNKINLTSGLLATFAAFFAPISLILYVLCAMVLLDLITAVIKAIKQTKKTDEYKSIKSYWKKFHMRFKTIKSNKIRRSAIKLFLYLILVMAVYAFEIAVFTRSIFLTNGVAGIIMLTELISISENCFDITGNSVFKKIIQKIRKPVEEKIEKQIKGE